MRNREVASIIRELADTMELLGEDRYRVANYRDAATRLEHHHEPIEVMAEAARARGYAYQVLTDHTQSLAIARGLTPERVAEQAEVIAALNARFAAEEAAGTAPSGAAAEGFRLLHGCELEVRADGALDFEDDQLARYDLVVASVHVARRQTRAELTARTLNAIRSPHVDVIAHPSGRKIGERDDLDLDWDAVYAEAARTGTALEMNGSPPRLDLSDQVLGHHREGLRLMGAIWLSCTGCT